MEILHKEPRGETLWREDDTLVLEFPRPQQVCSTSLLNGGLKEGIGAIFNQTCPPVTTAQELPKGSVEAYLAYVAALRGLNPLESTGLLTAASQRNAAVSCLSFRGLKVLTIVTGGIDHNGGRPGDPASYYEEEGRFLMVGGTINILVSTNAYLPPPTLLKAMITVTEAKSGALLELLAPSCYSTELATGSGTDGVIIASDPASTLVITDAGHHAKLGELIGRTVRRAVKKALLLETGLTPRRQLNILARLKRFGIGAEELWCAFQEDYPSGLDQEGYQVILKELAGKPELVALTSCLLHLADQSRWGLLTEQVAWQSAQGILGVAGLNLPMGLKLNKDKADKKLVELLVKGINKLILEQVRRPGK